jgi:predicted  nucleic acid-binding Zn-ribbon protein
MNTQEVIAKLNKYKEMLEQESDADIKARYAAKISQLEDSLKESEQKVEKLEQKVAAEEQKELSEVEKKIKKYQDFLSSESDPDIKARYQKKIKELQDSLKEVKEEIKEEKKEVAEQKAEIKKAVKAVKSAKATKVQKKEAIKKVEKKVRERKEVTEKRTRRGKKIKKIMSDLDRLIEGNKKLKAKYTGKGVDLKKDAARSAKPFGYRFKGKHDYRVPTKAQIIAGKASGKVVYEGRANRSDVYPKRTAKLADGGMMAEGAHIYNVGFEYYSNRGKNFEKDIKVIPIIANNEEEAAQIATSEFGKIGYYFKILRVDKADLRRERVMYQEKDRLPEWAVTINSEDGDSYEWIGFAKDEDSALYAAEQEAGFDSVESGVIMITDENGEKIEYKKGGKTPVIRTQFEEEEFEYGHGGHTQGYDDREDERLAMKHGKISHKDLHSTHARRDDARFEERGKMAKGGRVGHSHEDKVRFAKPAGWRWKNSAVTKKIISKAQLSKSPTKAMREKYPNYVYFENRLNKADKNPSRKYLSE